MFLSSDYWLWVAILTVVMLFVPITRKVRDARYKKGQREAKIPLTFRQNIISAFVAANLLVIIGFLLSKWLN